jgi:hypothetical protein
MEEMNTVRYSVSLSAHGMWITAPQGREEMGTQKQWKKRHRRRKRKSRWKT